MVLATNLGYPRIGAGRALKRLLESYWQGEIPATALEQGARDIRAANWMLQRAAGLDHIPSNDFSLYDQMLDMAVLFGAAPERLQPPSGHIDLPTYFAMARGSDAGPAMEMTKWFDTNYHYVVPELTAGQSFRLAGDKPMAEFREALALGIRTRPVLIGPVSFLMLSKMADGQGTPLDLIERLLPAYAALLTELAKAGAEWVQIDEPCLVLDLPGNAHRAFETAYAGLAAASHGLKLLVATYFGALGDNLDLALKLPVAAFHIDLVRAPDQLDPVLARLRPDMALSIGVIDGRNIWRADLDVSSALVARAVSALGSERVMVAPSCSLIHVPLDLKTETKLDPELIGWLAFARQKLDEIDALTRKAKGHDAAAAFEVSAAAVRSRRNSVRVHNAKVAAKLAAVTPAMAERAPYEQRRTKQAATLALPAFPTTTIGSFPQTDGVRKLRAAHRQGKLGNAEYEQFVAAEIAQAVRWQEEIGIDVLVHGEFERNDMVEYFGEQLDGFAFTQNGWVQSYGSRYVKPPILYGDVVRRGAMTVRWSAYAQSLTARPVKGMLTGPITMLQWSFVRDDQPRPITALQLALAIRDEVVDLEQAGIRIIQIDEPALREGLPLRLADRPAYLAWAVESFRIAAAGVALETQIDTHMCYAEFNDIIDAIAALDADVISIETSRSRMELLQAFEAFRYPAGIGPGVYDIHSPRIPDADDISGLLDRARRVLGDGQIWVNPDCGLKTRSWEQVKPALVNMVAAAESLRRKVN